MEPLGVNDPLPTEHLKRENRGEIDRDWSPEKREKMASTARSTARSNWGWAFVFNKALWGVGVLAERRRQRAVRKDRVIGKSGDRVIGKAKPYHG